MQINITGHHVEITPALRDYVESKLQKIERHFSHITNVYVTLTVDKKFQQKAEAKVNLARAEIHAESESENMYAAIDLLIDKLDRQVVKHKEKMNNHGDGEDLV
ncbi:ribosome hibernation-promoting factor, HPF/YfiA family [Candidatus Berkiella aquae]|uniref:Ribosome hibernation promoting factor n=1 Tax=Candidatus Berkiella aquae TaxID=295108 RepID=A0A0Q9YJ98_9GAMM|nr:ribosome-associated translation inhibitor RaiA [Candidatus Berkiella aquae]MCS5710727.1 ribosome-associated translation inhibitor RaiA [Candidatus Berkiella aquae]